MTHPMTREFRVHFEWDGIRGAERGAVHGLFARSADTPRLRDEIMGTYGIRLERAAYYAGFDTTPRVTWVELL